MFKWLKEWGEEVKNRFQAVVPGYFGGGWATNGLLTDPGTGTIFADTGSLPAGIYDFSHLVTASVSSAHTWFLLQHRNAANDRTLKTAGYANNTQTVITHGFKGYKIKGGERLRIISGVSWTATVQASIWYTRRFPLKRGQ